MTYQELPAGNNRPGTTGRELPARSHWCGRRIVGAGFAGGRNVSGARLLQQIFCARNFLRCVAMDRKKDAALLNVSFITLGFVLGNPKSDERAKKAADGSANADAGEGRH